MAGLSNAFKKTADKGVKKLFGTAVGITALAVLFKTQTADAFVYTMSSSQAAAQAGAQASTQVNHDAIIVGGLVVMGLIVGGALAYEGAKILRDTLKYR